MSSGTTPTKNHYGSYYHYYSHSYTIHEFRSPKTVDKGNRNLPAILWIKIQAFPISNNEVPAKHTHAKPNELIKTHMHANEFLTPLHSYSSRFVFVTILLSEARTKAMKKWRFEMNAKMQEKIEA